MRGLVFADTPVEPALMLRESDSPPRLYHDNRTPGFLLWMLDDAEPSQLVYLDNRVELATHDMWREFDRLNVGEGYKPVFEQHDVRAIVADVESQEGLVSAIRDDPDWRIAFENDEYVLFTRESSTDD
jgi:hypothetical protein